MNETLAHELRAAATITAMIWLTIGTGWLLGRFTPLPREATRKWVHAGSGITLVLLPALIDSHWTAFALSLGFAGLMGVTHALGSLTSVHGVGRGVGGVLWYPLAAWLTFWLAFDVLDAAYVTYAVAILVLALADTSGALVGKRWGRHRYRVAQDHYRSLEGSAAVAATSFACVIVPLWITDTVGTGQAALVALTAGVLLAVLEAGSRWGTDNLTLPLGALAATHWALGAPPEQRAAAAAAAIVCALGFCAFVASVQRDIRRRRLPTGPAASLPLDDAPVLDPARAGSAAGELQVVGGGPAKPAHD